jgi:hypothetical protein
MFAFSFIAILMAFGGMYAVNESRNLKAEDPWESVDLSRIRTKNSLSNQDISQPL